MSVAALYVDPMGPYPALLGAGACWDETRDARQYAGPEPVVAHPPCGPWGKLRRMSKRPQDRLLFEYAVQHVQVYGGVLEHPAGSAAWKAYGLPLPGQSEDNAFTVEVEQVEWGHVARKRTWLYIVGVPRELVEALIAARPFPGRQPTHWLSGFREHSRRGQTGQAVPPGIKVCSAQQRRRTPLAFAEFLIAIARQCMVSHQEGADAVA